MTEPDDGRRLSDIKGPPWLLSDLDAAHQAIGLGPEWLASQARQDLVDERTVLGEIIETDDTKEIET